MPAKAKATYESVRDAVSQLEKEGKPVTPTSVLSLTGGSRTTVYKFLQQLQDEDTKRQIKKPLPELEDLINEQSIAVITSLYEACKKRAEEIVLTEYESMKQRYSEWQKTAEKLDMIEEKYELKIQNFDLQEKTLKEENDKLKEMNNVLKDQNQTLKDQNQTLKDQNQILKEQINTLNKLNSKEK